MEEMTYQAVYERAADGTYWGYVPELPGAFGAGDTLEKAKTSLRDGIRLWLESARDGGIDIPLPSSSPIAVELIDVPVA
jgi:predicted RNase H-like HicB family nuclease